MISYIDIAFLIITSVIVGVNAKRGLIVSLLGMIRVFLIVPASYFLAVYIKPLLPIGLFGTLPAMLHTAVVFLICFLVLLILSAVIMNALTKLQSKRGMPLRHTNALLGALFGLAKAVVIVFALSSVISAALPLVPNTNELYEPLNTSYAVKIASNINPFELIGGAI